mgnify:CR=1 FL=1
MSEFVTVNHRGVDFQINRKGDVKTYKCTLKRWTKCNHYLNQDGYPTVSGYNRVKKQNVSVGIHVLMAKAFIPNPDNLPEVNHEDFDRTNYSLDNLEWISHKENVLYSRRANRYPNLMGEANPNYGNRKLSAYYKENKEVAKEKQGRPLGQNGKAKPCCLVNLLSDEQLKFSCQREAYYYLCDLGVIELNKYPETAIKKLRKDGGYRGYKIII